MNKDSYSDQITSKKENNSPEKKKEINEKITQSKSDNSPKMKILGILEKFITSHSNNKKIQKLELDIKNKNHSLKEQYNTTKGKLMSHDENNILNENLDKNYDKTDKIEN